MALPLPNTTAVQITRLTKALYDAAPGYTYMTAFTASAGTTTAEMSTFANWLAGTVSSDAATLASTVVTNLGLTGDAATAGTAYLTAQFESNAGNYGRVILDAMNALSTMESDATYGAAASDFNNSVATAYAYSIDADNTSTSLATLQAADEVSAATGQTFTLSTAIDTLAGTGGDDTFISDDGSLSAADSLTGGAGTDTLKVYGLSAAKALTMPQLSGIESLYVNGAAASLVLNVSNNADLTSVELDGQLGTAATLTVTTGQDVTLSNVSAAAFTTTIAGNNPTSLDVTLNKVGTAAIEEVIDFSGTALTTVNFTSSTANSPNVAFTNTGAQVNKLTFAGDKGVNLAMNAATAAAVKTVDASASTGGVMYDKVLGAANAAFAFTGGSGDDTLLLKAGDHAAMTAGTQIAMGSGTDKVGILDATAALTDAVYTKLNAMTGVEVLGINAATVVDATKYTAAKTFSFDTDAVQGVTGLATGSKLIFTVAHTAATSATMSVGVSDLSIQIGRNASDTEAATAGIAIGGNTTIAGQTVALSSLGTNAAANSMVLLNADNSTYTITGSNDLTLTGIQATAIASKFDGTAATGKLNITGNATAFSAGSTLGDIIIGGSAADTLKASVNGGTLTGNGGADTFNVSVALGGTSATFQTTTITDFTVGDKITFGGTAGAFTAAKVDLSGAATVGAALNLLAAGNNSDLKWGNFGGNTYIVDDLNAAATFSADDTFVKLTGTLDLSTSTFAGNTLTFA